MSSKPGSARRLSAYSPGGGCACKMPQALLDGVLTTVRASGVPLTDPALLVGLQSPDDAAVYAVDERRAWVVTCDFLPPLVDDAYKWGRIAAANALSDVYAMGGRPLLALNLLCWPGDLPERLLADVLRGGADAVIQAGALQVGGHSVVDPVPKYGLVVIGEADPQSLLRKGGGRVGDALVLTKPLGVGVVSTAIKRGAAPSAVVDTAAVPYLDGSREAAADGYISGGTRRNLDWVRPHLDVGTVGELQQLLLADAQTSGGLLVAGEVPGGTVIGQLVPRGEAIVALR